MASGGRELALTAQDLKELASPDPLPLPEAFAVLARLESESEEAVVRGDFRLFPSAVVGPSGARLLGRFCHADPDLAAGVAGHIRAEEALQPHPVFAEIVHLPEGRLGNILARPVFRSFEIPYLGQSALPPDRQIPLNDLAVSVVGDRVELTSIRLGRVVVPRLTNAHNFTAGRGVYQFLCALQSQGVASELHWDWGPLSASAFLPRVTCGRLVLVRARWRLSPVEAKRLTAGDAYRQYQAVQAWRFERHLPRWVCVTEHDHELPIDLDDRALVAVLLDEIRPDHPLTLTELFPGPSGLCCQGPEGRYVSEVVVPFTDRLRRCRRTDRRLCQRQQSLSSAPFPPPRTG